MLIWGLFTWKKGREREREMTGERDFFYCALICGTQFYFWIKTNGIKTNVTWTCSEA